MALDPVAGETTPPRMCPGQDQDGSARDGLPLRVVAIGGGSGLPAVLRGICAGGQGARLGVRPVELTAIVTTSDDGGSSGRLRREFGGPAPGDLRQCLAAVATQEPRWVQLFQHRFGGRGEMRGHVLGNLVLTALAEQLGDYGRALAATAELLGAAARVLPSTLQPTRLWSELLDGQIVTGEATLGHLGRRPGVRTLHLHPASPPAAPGVLEALAVADLIVVGPGSLFTSVLPNLLVRGVAPVMAASRARKVLIMNLHTQPGETDDLDAAGHVRVIRRHVGVRILDQVLVHRSPAARTEGSPRAVPYRPEELRAVGVTPFEADVATPPDVHGVVRHDPDKLARALAAIVGRPSSEQAAA